MSALFVSPRAPSHPLSPSAILFFVRSFFSHSFLIRWVLLCLQSPLPLLLLLPRSRSLARVSRVSGVSSCAFPVALLCRQFWWPLSGILPLSCFLFFLFSLLSLLFSGLPSICGPVLAAFARCILASFIQLGTWFLLFPLVPWFSLCFVFSR